MYINIDRALVFLLVMLRMTGMLMFNPILSRQNVPAMVNTGLAFVLAVTISGSRAFPPLPEVTLYSFFYLALKEMAIGLFAGFILRMFMSVLIIGGETMDMQLGLGMAKAFDPSSNSSVSISAQLLNVMFVLGFFQSNAHLTLILMTSKTFDVIQLGELAFNSNSFMAVVEMFTLIFLLAIKLCLPIVVMEIVVTFAVGMMMRIVPQINVFVVNIQFKLIVGLLVMVMLIPSFSAFCENLLMLCYDNIQQVWLKMT